MRQSRLKHSQPRGSWIRLRPIRTVGEVDVEVALTQTMQITTGCSAPVPVVSSGARGCDTLPAWPNRSSLKTSNSAFWRWSRLTAWRSLLGYSPASSPTPSRTRLGAPSWTVATPSWIRAASLESRRPRFTRASELARSAAAFDGSQRGARKREPRPDDADHRERASKASGHVSGVHVARQQRRRRSGAPSRLVAPLRRAGPRRAQE